MIILMSLMLAASDPAVDKPAEKPAKPKVICKTEKLTGSRLSMRRTCATQDEWDRLATETQREMRKATAVGTQPGAR